LFTIIGCQQSTPVASVYPAATFDAPKLVAHQPMQPAYIPPVTSAAPQVNAPITKASPMPGIPLAWVPPVAPRPWRWIIIHHSATTTGGAAAFDKMHRAKGWDELGYDFVIGNGTDTANGQIEVGPRWTKQKIGAHAKTPDNHFNEFGIGICMVGNFEVEKPTPQQMQSLEKLISYLMVTYHISPDHILGHGQTKETLCPGKYVNVPLIRQQATQLASQYMRIKSNVASANTELLSDVSNAR
jgi:hypothetical protein